MKKNVLRKIYSLILKKRCNDDPALSEFLKIITAHAKGKGKSVDRTDEVLSCPECQQDRLKKYKRVSVGKAKNKIYFYPELGYYFMTKGRIYLDSMLVESNGELTIHILDDENA